MHEGTVGVVIGTTEGPSEVLRIAVEAPEIRSVVCLGMSTEALPISPAYDAFVRRPTGVVERELGHSSYRADVSARIDNGNSWQLGLYLAHRLMAVGRLASSKDGADHWIWVTGTLDTDLIIGSVAEVPRKLEQSRDWFAARSDEGRGVAVIVPEQSADDLGSFPTDVTVLAEPGVAPILTYLGLDLPDEPGGGRASAPEEVSNHPLKAPAPAASRSGLSAVIVLALMVFSSAMAVWLVDPSLFERAIAMLPGQAVQGEPAVARVRGIVSIPKISSASPREELGVVPGLPDESPEIIEVPEIAPTPTPTPAPTVAPVPVLELTWSLGYPKHGARCGGDLVFTPFNGKRQDRSGPICQVAVEASNRSNTLTLIDATAGILGRMREYMRKSRHVLRERAVLKPGGTMRLVLDVPGWVRGDIQVRAVVRPRDASSKISDEANEASALETITTPPTGLDVIVSTIKLN